VFDRIKNFDTAGFIFVSRIAGAGRDGWSFGVTKSNEMKIVNYLTYRPPDNLQTVELVNVYCKINNYNKIK